MSRIWKTWVVLAGCLATVGCLQRPLVVGSGVIVGESYDLTDFSRLSVHDVMDVTVLQGDGYAVEVSADDNVIELVKIEQYEDQLRIGLARPVNLEGATIVCVVHLPELTEVAMHGASKLHFKSLASEQLELALSGATHVDGQLVGGDITLRLSGAARAELAGQAETLVATVEGASSARLGELVVSRNASVETQGASNAQIHVLGELSMAARGASHVSFLGTPTVTRSETQGASSIGPE